jgi:hypothetical protein
MRVAGLAAVQQPGIENYNVTEFVPGHMSYRTAMPRLLREVGWAVESDEFTEIEDPDPENHEKRQRELINEIEEARKLAQTKPAKSKFGWFRRKNATEKKEWEMYDEKMREGTDDAATLEGKASGVLFNIDALRAEVAELAAQGIQVKELPESTLPPMRLDLSRTNTSSPGGWVEKRYNDYDYDDRSHSAPPSKSVFSTPPPHSASFANSERSPSPSKAGSKMALPTVTAAVPEIRLERSATSPATPSAAEGSNSSSSVSKRPQLASSATMPTVPIVSLEHNAWADEFDEDFGKEKEMTMTFE